MTMQIDIHDVGHGGCAVVTGPDGCRLMLDCGFNGSDPWFPSVAYNGQRIDTLMLMNLDEDHCDDLAYVWRDCPIGAIVSNPTVSGPALRAMKAKCGMRNGVETAAALLERFGPGFVGDWKNDLGGVRWHAFWNRYGLDFRDTNNLSLAAFVTFGNFTILFGGDMERAGWGRLLESAGFRARLPSVSVYVASHHGRENGCCEELFRLCRPELVVFSDGSKQHGTQETSGWYSNRTTGIPDLSRAGGLLGPPRRKVMTTRSDGSIRIAVEVDGRYLVTPSKRTPAALPPALGNPFGVRPPSPNSLVALAFAGS